jgi:UDP-N-acetyl-D-mannosaminuronic acid dehydrogenase
LDPWFIKEVDPENSRLIFTSRLINDEMPDRIAAMIRRSVRNVSNPQIVAIGAAYKADVDDLRESPAMRIVELLRQDGYRVDHFDPLIPGMSYPSLVEVCREKDCLVVLVEHEVVRDELRTCGEQLNTVMRNPSILRFYQESDFDDGDGSTMES